MNLKILIDERREFYLVNLSKGVFLDVYLW